MIGTSHKQGLQWLRENATLTGVCGSLHDHDVDGEVCKHDEHELMSYLVVWMTASLGLIDDASLTEVNGHCWQQQLPDGQSSAWTEWSSETVHGKVGAKSELLCNGYETVG